MTYTIRRLYDRPCTLLLDDRPIASLYCTDAEADAMLAALSSGPVLRGVIAVGVGFARLGGHDPDRIGNFVDAAAVLSRMGEP